MFNLLDAHCDTIVRMKDENAELYDNNLHVSIKKLQKFNAPVQFFAICQAERVLEDCYQWFLDMANFFHKNMEENAAYISQVKCYQGILDNRKQGKISALLAIEGAEVLLGNLDYLHNVYALGVRSITLTWNFSNELGRSSHSGDKGGLTETGRAFIKEMNKMGIIADASHLSDNGFWDLCEHSSKPFIASHSNSYTVCPHTRNLKDEQLKALGETRGVAGLNLCAAFLKEDSRPDMDIVLKHLDKMLTLAGADSVGIGCDFDGIPNPDFELDNVSKMDILHTACEKAFGREVTEKIFFDNFMRILKECL